LEANAASFAIGVCFPWQFFPLWTKVGAIAELFSRADTRNEQMVSLMLAKMKSPANKHTIGLGKGNWTI
jgi:hypothetical protein